MSRRVEEDGVVAEQPGWGSDARPPKKSERATWVMALGVGSIVVTFVCGIGFIPATIALSLAPAARREIAASAGAMSGAGQIRTGVTCAWITIGLTVLAFVVLAVLLAADAGGLGFDGMWDIG
jgi:hypothetical protein